jgi:hypothetical protein
MPSYLFNALFSLLSNFICLIYYKSYRKYSYILDALDSIVQLEKKIN